LAPPQVPGAKRRGAAKRSRRGAANPLSVIASHALWSPRRSPERSAGEQRSEAGGAQPTLYRHCELRTLVPPQVPGAQRRGAAKRSRRGAANPLSSLRGGRSPPWQSRPHMQLDSRAWYPALEVKAPASLVGPRSGRDCHGPSGLAMTPHGPASRRRPLGVVSRFWRECPRVTGRPPVRPGLPRPSGPRNDAPRPGVASATAGRVLHRLSLGATYIGTRSDAEGEGRSRAGGVGGSWDGQTVQTRRMPLSRVSLRGGRSPPWQSRPRPPSTPLRTVLRWNDRIPRPAPMERAGPRVPRASPIAGHTAFTPGLRFTSTRAHRAVRSVGATAQSYTPIAARPTSPGCRAAAAGPAPRRAGA